MDWWFGWSGFLVARRNCLESMSQCSLTGIILVSLCKWLTCDIFTHPVVTLRAAFCSAWRPLQEVSESGGVQIGAQ